MTLAIRPFRRSLAAALVAAALAGCLQAPPPAPAPVPAAAAGIRLQGRVQLQPTRRLQAFAGWAAADVARWTATLIDEDDRETPQDYDGPITAGSTVAFAHLKPDTTYRLRIDAYVAGSDASITDAEGSTTEIETGPTGDGRYETVLDRDLAVAIAPRPFPGRLPVTVAVASGAFDATRVRLLEKPEGASQFKERASEPLGLAGGTLAFAHLRPSATYLVVAEGLVDGEVVDSDDAELRPDPDQADATGRLPGLDFDLVGPAGTAQPVVLHGMPLTSGKATVTDEGDATTLALDANQRATFTLAGLPAMVAGTKLENSLRFTLANAGRGNLIGLRVTGTFAGQDAPIEDGTHLGFPSLRVWLQSLSVWTQTSPADQFAAWSLPTNRPSNLRLVFYRGSDETFGGGTLQNETTLQHDISFAGPGASSAKFALTFENTTSSPKAIRVRDFARSGGFLIP